MVLVGVRDIMMIPACHCPFLLRSLDVHVTCIPLSNEALSILFSALVIPIVDLDDIDDSWLHRLCV